MINSMNKTRSMARFTRKEIPDVENYIRPIVRGIFGIYLYLYSFFRKIKFYCK